MIKLICPHCGDDVTAIGLDEDDNECFRCIECDNEFTFDEASWKEN